MKKFIITTLVLTCSFFAHADSIDRLWKSLYTVVPTGLGEEVNGDGAGWWVEIWDLDNNEATGGNTTATAFGWFDGNGYTINDFTFGPSAENNFVALRLYNNTDTALATYSIQSTAQQLSDLDDLAVPDLSALELTFDFTGQTWQAVPEPATFLLFGIGGFGAWLIRRNKLKAKEEADA